MVVFRKIHENRLIQTLKDIDDNKDHWQQDMWHCGTSHCFAGFAEMRWKSERNNVDIEQYLDTQDLGICYLDTKNINEKYFGIDAYSWNKLTHANNTRQNLEDIVQNIIANKGKYTFECSIYED